MNLIEAVNEHRKMWKWIARNIILIKPNNLPQMKKIYITCVTNQPLNSVYNLCYLCEYVVEKECVLDCEKCPLNFSNHNCFTGDSLYNRIVTHIRVGEYKKASKLAYKMAMLHIKCDINSLYPSILPFS